MCVTTTCSVVWNLLYGVLMTITNFAQDLTLQRRNLAQKFVLTCRSYKINYIYFLFFYTCSIISVENAENARNKRLRRIFRILQFEVHWILKVNVTMWSAWALHEGMSFKIMNKLLFQNTYNHEPDHNGENSPSRNHNFMKKYPKIFFLIYAVKI